MTLWQALERAARLGTGGVICVRADGSEVRRSYPELLDEARRIAGGLVAAGLAPGDTVLLQLERAEDFIPGFWGCVAAGLVPAPVAVAPTYAQASGALQKLLNASRLLERAPVFAAGAAAAGLRKLPAALGALSGAVLDLDELRRGEAPEALPARAPTDDAVLLLTSGSTGQPKGVPLTHRNLLAMSAGTIAAGDFTSAEVTLNWMALDHVGAVSFLGTMAVDLGCTQVHVPTGYILQDPLRWLELIHRHRATISWAPNFAFTLFLEREAAVRAGVWDLRCMRFLVNAGEAVVARTARRFISLLQPHGLPADALRPAFGMSETCSGITWSRGFTLENSSDDQAFVDLGPCIAGSEMRVVDERGEMVEEGQPGLLQMRGVSVFSGYFRNPEENARVFSDDGWFTTGDLAFIRDGCLTITGRQKDVIIVNGANFYCHEIETLAETVPGVRKTFTAACAVRDAAAETDQLALFFCAEEGASVEAIARAVRAKLIQEAGVPAAYLIALSPADVPKTEIGKIQRAQLKKAFEAGTFRDRVVVLARKAAAARAPKRGGTRSELAPAIADIWADVLALESVGYDETFFELGGHSLLVVQVQKRLEELIGRPVTVVELFECPTVRTMAAHFAKDFEPARSSDDVGHAARPRAEATTPPGGAGSRDIAIVGIGLRFPGASSPAEFWQVLAEGRETIRFFTAEDALKAGVDPELVRNPNHVKAAPMLDAPENFDAEFFKYTAKEARLIDPQQRVFLEVCWEAFEDAGYDPLSFPGRVGLFAAAGMNTYLANNLLANGEFLQEENGGRMLTVDSMSGFNVMITNDKDYLPTRVSYKLNLRGPSLNIQTACSSTLVTLHEACNSLLVGDCEMALAGGVSIKLPQHAGHLYSAGMLNSPDGHCRAYDEKAEGTIFGNGAGVVLLKPLAAALADGDRIYAVVKGTATNNDGGGKVGFTAPSAAGEEDVCAQALARAGFSADTVTFMEGHGTGTPLGDPIEVNALSAAFRRDTPRAGYCALGSVKTNVGHLQIASGIAGLIKTALALHHKAIPGTLHFEKPNPRIDFSRTPFFVTRETRAWEVSGHPRRAGVNSLGIGGSNVHAILEEAPVASPVAAPATTAPEVLPLSARHPRALRQLAQRYADLLESSAAPSLADIAYTAQVGRAALPLRAAFTGESPAALVAQLRAFAGRDDALPSTVDFEKQGLAFFYGGETGGLPPAARALYEREPAFRLAFDRCAEILDTELGAPFLRVLWGGADVAAGVRPLVGAPEFGHAAACAYHYALGELLASFGVEPTWVTGQGLGEYAAACRAGVFALEDSLRLAIARGRSLAVSSGAAALREFSAVAESIEYSAPALTFVTDGDPATAEYWLRHRQAPTLGRDLGASVCVALGLRSGDDEGMIVAGDLAATLGTLFAAGYPVKWMAGRRQRPARRVTLPTYPWQHQAFWIEGADFHRPKIARAEPGDPLLGRCWRSPRVREVVYETTFDVTTLPCLAEHHVHGRVVTPGALYLSQVARQAAHLLGGKAALRDVLFVRAMVFETGESRTVQTVFVPEGSGYRFEVLSWSITAPDTIVVHATGAVAAATSDAAAAPLAAPVNGSRAVARHYAVMDAMAVKLGPSFRWIREIRTAPGESWVRLEAPAGLEGTSDWHPGLVDSLLQAAVPAAELDGSRTLIPFRIERVVFHAPPDGGPLFSQARRAMTATEGVRTDVQVRDAAGRLLVEVSGFELRSLQPADVQAALRAGGTPELFETVWEPLTAPAVSGEAGEWLLLAGGREAEAIRRTLEQAGAQVITVPSAEPARAEALLRERSWRGVVHAWNFSVETPAALAWRELLGSVRAAAMRSYAPRFVMVTAAGSLAQTPLAGFTVGLAHEFSEWRPVHVELAPGAADFSRCLPWLFDRTSTESRLPVRDGVVLGARLVEKRAVDSAMRVRADGSYLITGGAGALGQVLAEWLVAKGARSLVLTGRRAAPDDLQARIALWQSGGVDVAYEVADIGAPDAAQKLVARAEALAPLCGVFHAAGSLRDGLLRNADPEVFVSTFDAKIDGAWALHFATHGRKLDCFVLFSSIASLLGSPAQANYAAGNAFLDGLALHRQRVGLPALSIQWGPWDGIGMSARLQERDRQRLLERGLVPMESAAALRALDNLLGSQGCVGVFAWDRERYRASLGNSAPAFYSRLFKPEARPATTSASRAEALAALPLAERTEAVEWLIRETVATLLGLESSRLVEREKSLFDLGLDSLTSVDLKDRLEKALGHTLRTTVAFDYPTAAEMAAHLAMSLFPQASEPAPAAVAAPKPAAPVAAIAAPKDDLDNLSASDLEALLAEELKG